MNRERNLKKPGFNFFKTRQFTPSKNRRKEFPYSISEKRIKKSRFRSPEKHGIKKSRFSSPEEHGIKKSRFSSPDEHGGKKSSVEAKIPEGISDDIPDRSYGDFYCKACDSHMSSELTFECHVQGKRHLRNTGRVGAASEYEFVDQDPLMLPEIKKLKKPVIGLQHCCELLRPNEPPIYQCFLCSISIPNSKLLIEHVIGLKHRMAYLKIHDSVNYSVIMKAELKKGMIEPVVEEFIQKYQNKHGLGKMRVKIKKSTPSPSGDNPERPYKDDLIHKRNKNFGRDSYDDVRNESKSEDFDRKYDKNSYNDVRNESKSPDSDRKYIKISYDDVRNESRSPDSDQKYSKNSYDDVRNESKSPDSDQKYSKTSYDKVRKKFKSEDSDWKNLKNSYDKVGNESISEDSQWRLSRNSYDDVRREFKVENSNWRLISGEETDNHNKDKYASELRYEKSPEQQDKYNKIETVYSGGRSETPPLNSINYEESESGLYSNLNWNMPDQASQEDLRVFLQKKRMLEANTSTAPNTTNSLEYVLQKRMLEANTAAAANNTNSLEYVLQQRMLETNAASAANNTNSLEYVLQKRMLETNAATAPNDTSSLEFVLYKRMLEANSTAAPVAPNNTNSVESIFSLIEDMPTMKFLELVLHKVEKIEDPSETEVNMLSKIGKHMFKIVMKKKMDMLTPDLRKKCQDVTEDNVNQPTAERTATPEHKNTNKFDFQSLMDLIKNPKRESEKPQVNYTFPLQSISSQLGVASTSNQHPAYSIAPSNFMSNFVEVPSSLASSSLRDFSAIPGLNVSGSREISSGNRFSYPQNLSQESYVPGHNIQYTIQYKDNLNPY